MSTEEEIRTFIIKNFIFAADGVKLTDDLSLFDSGVVDSTGVLEIIEFLEDTYEVEVEDEELVEDNFETISRLTAYVKRKRP